MRQLLQNRKALYAAVGIVAVAIAAALIAVSVSGSGKKTHPAATTESGGAPSTTSPPGVVLSGATETQKLFRGIPQTLNALGNPKAPVTMIEFADLQCPYCRDFAVQALPELISRYIRPGKVKLVFFGVALIGADSERALRATYAAGLQSKLWNYLDLLYRNQGEENSGWVSDALLRAAAKATPGVDIGALMAARQTAEVDAALAASSQQASSAQVHSTPTFFAGPTGGTLNQVAVASLTPSAFEPTLDSLLK